MNVLFYFRLLLFFELVKSSMSLTLIMYNFNVKHVIGPVPLVPERCEWTPKAIDRLEAL